jgi:hypothetical protein
MYFKSTVIISVVVIASQIYCVDSWAYRFGIGTNTICDTWTNCITNSLAECVTDTCGTCGIQAALYNTDITDPPEYGNDNCNPCVTYDSAGLTMDEIDRLADDAPAGTITVAKTGETMSCKKITTTDCSAISVFSNYAYHMRIACDPTLDPPPQPPRSLPPLRILSLGASIMWGAGSSRGNG